MIPFLIFLYVNKWFNFFYFNCDTIICERIINNKNKARNFKFPAYNNIKYITLIFQAFLLQHFELN